MLFSALFLGLFASCNKGQDSSPSQKASLKTGDCLDQALSPYVLKVAAIEGETVFFYHLGAMGKKIFQRTKTELLKGESPFKVTACP